MKSRLILTTVLLLFVLGTGYWWFTIRTSPADARDALSLGVAAASKAIEEVPNGALPIPDPAPAPLAELPADQGGDDSQRATAAPAGRQDLEVKYSQKTSEELQAAVKTLSRQAADAQAALFDDLFPKFPELLAQGRYGARVIPKGESFSTIGGGKCAMCRWVKNADGIEEGHYLEFVGSDEPATRAILAEQDWVLARLTGVAKKD